MYIQCVCETGWIIQVFGKRSPQCRVDVVRGAIRRHHIKAFMGHFRPLETTRIVSDTASSPTRSLQTIASCSERSQKTGGSHTPCRKWNRKVGDICFLRRPYSSKKVRKTKDCYCPIVYDTTWLFSWEENLNLTLQLKSQHLPKFLTQWKQ